jgi:hypothetical protein
VADRWGWSEQWDQLALAGHTCVTLDTVEETLVLRVWDPIDPEHEVVRVSLDPSAARKLGTLLLLGASASEWEHMGRGLEHALRQLAAAAADRDRLDRQRQLEALGAGEPEPDEVDLEPEVTTGRCPWCSSPALATEEQHREGEVQWLARCGARWLVPTAGDGLAVQDPCPTERRSATHR